MCIEYDGRHHYEVIYDWCGEEYLDKIKINDSIKNKYCEENNIILLRISYKEDIDDILTKVLQHLIHH
jgi:hypothetical protein